MPGSVQSVLGASSGPARAVSAAPLHPRLLLVRHAESQWNEEGRLQGQLDPPLSELGRRQAVKLAQRMARHRPAAIYTSDLERCLQTAAPLAYELGLDPQLTPSLREVHL